MSDKGDTSMNLLEMSKEQRLMEIKAAKSRMEEERMGNDPITKEANYLDFIVAGYESDKSEGEA